MSKFNILPEEKRCEGCFHCVLRCSLRFREGFNPEKAAIKIVVHLDQDNEILFRENCDRCGICARHCPCDALRLEKIGEK